MDLNGFKKAISKSVVKNVIVGGGIFLFGVFIAWLVLSGADSEMKDITIGGLIVIWVLAGLCLFFGFFITFQHIRNHLKVKKGDHPLVNAIEQGNKGYLIWIYEYVTQVQGGGSDHQIWAFSQDGEKHILSLKKKRIGEVMDYLSKEFPNAVVGYSEEIRDRMSASLGKKL